MKKLAGVALMVVLLTLGLVSGCAGIKVIGSGNLTTKTFDFSDFTGIKAENGMHVELTRSGSFNVEVIADDNVMEHIQVSKSGDTLRVKPRSNAAFRDATLKTKISMPELYKLELFGGSHASVSGFESSHDLWVNLSGGSHLNEPLNPGDISAGNVEFNLSGGSHVDLSGSADDLNVKAIGGSHINLENLTVKDANIKLGGGSHATVNVNGTINVDISGGSKVYYVGESTMGDIDVEWDSDLIRK